MDEATQPSTQPYNDPRRLGRNNSGMSDHDVVDVICILHPMNALALEVVKNMTRSNPQHILQNDDLINGFDPDDLQMNLMMQSPSFERDLALRMSSTLKNPAAGFTFGRNPARCDVVLADEKEKNVSNIHFSISLNANGILMLEDLSTNGTAVDGQWYRKTAGPKHATTMLQPNTDIAVFTKNKEMVSFMVRYPPRGEYTEAYNAKLRDYITRRPGMEGTNIVPSISTYDTSYGMHWNGGSTYNVVGHLGKGAFATVYKLATKRDGKVFAAKELDKRRFMKNGILDLKVENEMKIMASLRHPNIVQYESYYDYSHWIYIIMEYISGGELSSHVAQYGPVPEPVGQDITRQILHALDYLHKRKITHRDIKPDNILIANYQPLTVKLSDFGLSKCVTNQETFLKTFCGTLLYCAPEVYPDYSSYQTNPLRTKRRRGDPRSKTSPYSQAVDMWSFGAVLYHILSNKPPVIGKGDDRGIHMLNNIMTKEIDYNPLRVVNMSEAGIDFISALLNRDPELRPNEKMCFSHSWIADIQDHVDYSNIEDDLPKEYCDHLATVDELDEAIWDDEEPLEYIDNGKENLMPEELATDYDRLDPRYQSKRQRLRGGAAIEQAFSPPADVNYPTLPNVESSLTKSANKRGPRLFGEILQSALRSSGVFGQAQNEVVDLPSLRKSVENISVNDFVTTGGEMSEHSDISAETDVQYQNAINAPLVTAQSAAPSLFGAEQDFRGLNMTSPDARSRGTTPDTGNPTTPQTREATPGDTETIARVNSDRMAPPPLPAGGRRKSAPKVDPIPSAGSLHEMPEIPGTRLDLNMPNSNDRLVEEDHPRTPVFDVTPGTEQAKKQSNSAVHGSNEVTNLPQQNSQDQSPVRQSQSIPGNPSTLKQTSIVPAILGRIVTIPGSIITGDFPLTNLRTVYGRGIDSNIKYPNVYDTRIPKYGLKLTFHGTDISNLDSYLASGNNFSVIPGLYVSITTSATRGIYVNGIHLPNQDKKKDGWYWGQIQTGDIITLYEGENGKGGKEFLKFAVEINYGDSAAMRLEGDEPFTVRWQRKKATLSENGSS